MLLQQIDYRRLGELRAGLELQAALLALGRITDEQVRELSGMVEEMASCSSKRAAQLDKQLHDTIAAISGNELIIQIHRALSTTIDRFITDMRRHILRNFQTGNQLAVRPRTDCGRSGHAGDKAQLILAINHHFNVISANMEQNL